MNSSLTNDNEFEKLAPATIVTLFTEKVYKRKLKVLLGININFQFKLIQHLTTIASKYALYTLFHSNTLSSVSL